MSLKKLLKKEPTREEMLHVFREIWNEQSSRAAALSSAAMAEVGLTSALRARLWTKNGDADDELFGLDGPLSTFSQKIRMAEAIRIIGPITRKNFDDIKQIRNAFAHTHKNITFDTPEVAEICARITHDVRPQRPRPPYMATPRDHYVYAALALFIALEETANQTKTGIAADPYSAYPFVSGGTRSFPHRFPDTARVCWHL